MDAAGGQEAKDLSGRRVLVALCGGIAAYKVVEVVRRLIKRGADVRVMMTEAATRFVSPVTFAAITGQRVGLNMWSDPGDSSVDHLQLPHSADLILVAPATANMIAKMAAGLADDLVSTALVAAHCPVIIAPAMNTHMYAHPSVSRNLATLAQRGVHQVGPAKGEMAAPGEEPGFGRMSEPEEIVEAVAGLLLDSSTGPLAGRTVLITAGRTEEPIDDVRVITNRSSGRMGVALAEAARNAGARVIFVHGPMDVAPPDGVETVQIRSAQEMRDAVVSRVASCNAVLYVAAVADWRPKAVFKGKMKKEGTAPPSIEFVENPDVAAETAKLCPGFTLGFALETSESRENAENKLKRKGLSAILLNTADAIGSDSSKLTWIQPGQPAENSGRRSKRDLAQWVISHLAERIHA
ncbi:MAG: bifunctional phosphopantothenoylcysteine decarboxylase/phosphopantothenate--cysteine ligase CoaBC [bacterium]